MNEKERKKAYAHAVKCILEEGRHTSESVDRSRVTCQSESEQEELRPECSS